VAEPVRVRRLTDQEVQGRQQIVRHGSTRSVRYLRVMMLLASAGGNRVPVIAQLVQADKDTVRDVIHRCNGIGLSCLDPQWAGGRPRLLSPDGGTEVDPRRPARRRTHLRDPGQPACLLRWRHANARHRDVLAAERRERARIRSEKGIRCGRRPLKAAA
jgi:hypothetical protein